MPNEVENFISNAVTVNDEIQNTFGGLSNEQLNWKLNEKEWSIAQCLEHLVVTNDLYFENIQKVADGTHSNNFYSKVPLATGLVGWGMKKVLSPDFRPKVKTLKMFEPAQSQVSANILEDFEKNQKRFVSLMEATEGMDVERIKIAEPIGAAVNLKLIDAFEILLVHEKRHFNQAKRVRESDGFPESGENK